MKITPDAPPRQITHEILDSCRQLVNRLHVASKSSEKHLGLSAAQLFVLTKLSDGQPRSINELASLTRTHQSSVSVVVKKLVEKKLVKSQVSKSDARRLELRVTVAGAKKLKGASEPIQERLIRGIESLSERDRQRLDRLLKRMLCNIPISEAPARLFFED